MNALSKWATGKEILSQPDVWSAWAPELESIAQNIRAWVAERNPDEILLTGAGTSAFIGLSLEHMLSTLIKRRVRAVASTDLVAAPYHFLADGKRPLVVSFGRSGNSSESVGTMELLDRFCPKADRLNITCNKDSALANTEVPGPGETRVVVLPDSTHDTGFAMTSSYSTMLFTAMTCLGQQNRLHEMAEAGRVALSHGLETYGLQDCPERVVFLGAGPLVGAARESALKILELTKGEVPTLWDTPLGFRHGPKSFVTAKTKVVLFKSAHPITRCYDNDLEHELRAQFGKDSVVSIGGHPSDADVTLPLSAEDAWNAPIFVIPSQLAGVEWADAKGINVDNPFIDEANLTRVVSNVRLHTDRGW